MNQIKQRRYFGYCYKTKWISTRACMECMQCDALRMHLTLDGIRLKRLGVFVDKKAEERTIQSLYYFPVRRRLNF